MTKIPENKQERGVPSNEAGTMSLLISMADTTWRMFIPPAVLVPAGIWADLKVGSKPWLTLAAAVLGLTLSILLVKHQLRESI